MKLSSVAFLFLLGSTAGNENAKRLFDELLSQYNKLLRPSVKPQDILTIRLKLRLSQIIDVHEKDQIMTSSVWLRQEWHDPKLMWDPEHYGNVSVLYVPASIIWTPDIVLYNNADSTYNITISTKATLHYTGTVTWEPPALFKSMCPIEVEWFPFDTQTCHLKFGSWSYSEEALDLQHLDVNVTYSQETDPKTGEVSKVAEVENGMDLSEYYPSVEWDIIRIPARRHGKTYPSCCPKSPAFIDITYYIHLRRKPLFYTVNFIFPCVGISFLTIVVFYLPSDTGEKISLSISILVSLTVFFLLLTEIIPSTSIVLPLICKYLLFTMVMVTLSVLVTVVVLNVHFRRPTTHSMPRWVRLVFLRYLPKWLFMGRPAEYGRSVDLPSSPSNMSTSTVTTPLISPSTSYRPINRRKPMNLDEACSVYTRTTACPCETVVHSPQSSPKVVTAFDNVCFIASLLKTREKETENEEDWKYVAMVLDRLFLLVFAIACFLGTVGILLRAPSLYDNAKAIDGRAPPQLEQ